jgi:hypothetical protein
VNTLDLKKADATLAGSLGRVLRCLHAGRYERLRDELWHSLLNASDTFGTTLAAHLDEEERHVYPALEAAAPERASEIEALRREHAELRERAADLDARIHAGDSVMALETGRELFGILVAHASRERALIDAVVPTRERRR